MTKVLPKSRSDASYWFMIGGIQGTLTGSLIAVIVFILSQSLYPMLIFSVSALLSLYFWYRCDFALHPGQYRWKDLS